MGTNDTKAILGIELKAAILCFMAAQNGRQLQAFRDANPFLNKPFPVRQREHCGELEWF